MLTEEYFAAVSGPQLTSNTAVAKDVGIYELSFAPNYGVKSTFKKSSCPTYCLAASDTHVFAAQQDKAYVHVYSRLKGNQEAFVALSDRIRSLILVEGNVLVLGTVEGKILLWEICTGRLVSTPTVHVQAVSCMAATQSHLITGSDDSNLQVWSLARLLEPDMGDSPEPERTLANHRGAITCLLASTSSNPFSSLCVSASRDKTCIIWNHQTGEALRTILFPCVPLCLAIDSLPRTVVVSSDDGSIHVINLFTGNNPLIGGRSTELPSTLVKAPAPVAYTGTDRGPASCLALSHDGNSLLTGHPRGQIVRWSLNGHDAELVNLNASVTNILFTPPRGLSTPRHTRPLQVVKPAGVAGSGTADASLMTQFEQEIELDPKNQTRFNRLLRYRGFPADVLLEAARTLDKPARVDSSGQDEEELRAIMDKLGCIMSIT